MGLTLYVMITQSFYIFSPYWHIVTGQTLIKTVTWGCRESGRLVGEEVFVSTLKHMTMNVCSQCDVLTVKDDKRHAFYVFSACRSRSCKWKKKKKQIQSEGRISEAGGEKMYVSGTNSKLFLNRRCQCAVLNTCSFGTNSMVIFLSPRAAWLKLDMEVRDMCCCCWVTWFRAYFMIPFVHVHVCFNVQMHICMCRHCATLLKCMRVSLHMFAPCGCESEHAHMQCSHLASRHGLHLGIRARAETANGAGWCGQFQPLAQGNPHIGNPVPMGVSFQGSDVWRDVYRGASLWCTKRLQPGIITYMSNMTVQWFRWQWNAGIQSIVNSACVTWLGVPERRI